MNPEELLRKARDLTPYGVIPPFMRIKAFLESLWPMSRTSLFEAIRLRKFHTFILKDGLATGGVRVIDTASALAYLKTLSEAAKKEDAKALKQRQTPPAKRTPQQRQSAVQEVAPCET